jgi:hypothetical protein
MTHVDLRRGNALKSLPTFLKSADHPVRLTARGFSCRSVNAAVVVHGAVMIGSGAARSGAKSFTYTGDPTAGDPPSQSKRLLHGVERLAAVAG